MASVRVFLCTYRRPHLLRRALSGLLSQTFTDWTCELHNDAPDDDTPRQVLAELAAGDPRFCYCPHERNWGAVATFNHVFTGGPEPFGSLLEDDNWWDSTFLQTAVSALHEHPAAALAWTNMRIWQEQPDGGWRDTGRTIWHISPQTPPICEFHPLEVLQAFDALHSNGAMVFRPARLRAPRLPAQVPFALYEAANERSADGSLLLLTRPLAHFAETLASARSPDPTQWLQMKLLLAASFFQHVAVDPHALERIWSARRSKRPRDTDLFFSLALSLRSPRLLRPARVLDWLHFLLHTGRHPLRFARGLQFRRDHPDAWSWLCNQTVATGTQSARMTLVSKEVR